MSKNNNLNVQQWVDNLPSVAPSFSAFQYIQAQRNKCLLRDVSIQSSDCSHCSSVESVLECRQPDPEAVLLGLGFGPKNANNIASRIPERFLQPSKIIKHIDINKFLEEQGQLPIADHIVSMPPTPEKQRPKTC